VFCLAAAAQAAFPSPEDWRDENIYFIFLVSFYVVTRPNNRCRKRARGAGTSPSDAHAIHGGDLKGVQQSSTTSSRWARRHLDTPIPYKRRGSAFHGYGAQDFIR